MPVVAFAVTELMIPLAFRSRRAGGHSYGCEDPEESAALIARLTEPDFLACGFVHIGIWGRQPRQTL
jgi:hypothetical protein